MFASNSRAFPVQCPLFSASGDLRPMDSPIDVWRPCLSTKICNQWVSSAMEFCFSHFEFRITWFSGWWGGIPTPEKWWTTRQLGWLVHSIPNIWKVINPAMYIIITPYHHQSHRVWQLSCDLRFPIRNPNILTPHMPAHGGGRSPRRGLTSSTWPGGNANAKRSLPTSSGNVDLGLWFFWGR